MKIIKFIYTLILVSILLMVAGACSQDTSTPEAPSKDIIPLNIRMEIEGQNRLSSRAQRIDTDDQWSYVGFDDGDSMGFYASGGNWLNGGVFDNFKLVYVDGTQFKDPDGSGFSPSDMKGDEVFMYFPYSADMNGNGMELRVRENGSLRCVDLLTTNELTIFSEKSALYGKFQHTFAELIIMRGEGFDSPPPDTAETQYSRITAVINTGYTNISIVMNSTEDSWSCTPILSYYPSNTNNLDEEAARRWNAWKGDNYGITEEDTEGTPAWYVIIPTLGKSGTGRSLVDYIELYDNEGNLQRISSFKFYGAAGEQSTPTKYLDSGWRYPMEITMQELVPTVNPFPIKRWEKTIDLTDQRKNGINDLAEFERFVSDYNAYLADPTNNEKQIPLYDYGDLYKDSNTGVASWHFYLLSDLDLSTYKPKAWIDENGNEVQPSGTSIIPNFEDVIEGQSSTLSGGEFLNFKLTGLNRPFVGNMLIGSQLNNIDFVEPDLKVEGSANTPLGILAITMTQGIVNNCNIINGILLNANGPGGMVAGSMAGGSISNCNISGTLVVTSGAQTPEEAVFLVGVNPTGIPEFKNNEVNVVSY